MAISPTLGATASNAVAGGSLAFASASQTNGQYYVITISIAGTATVSSISDGTNTFTFRSGITNGTSVRSEIWTMVVTGSSASRTITINFSGSTLASASYEEYAGPTAIGNIGTPATGTGAPAGSTVVTQDNGSYSVTCIAIATSSGDTVASNVGFIRQSIIPALTTAANVLMDSTAPYTSNWPDNIILSNNTRLWASTSLELRTGVTPSTIAASKAVGPATRAGSTNYQVVKAPPPTSGSTPVPVAQILQGGTTGIVYSETISAQGGVPAYTFTVTIGALPTGLSLAGATGIISGTPSAVGTYNFTVQVTDSNGSTGTQGFRIIVVAPTTGAGALVWVG